MNTYEKDILELIDEQAKEDSEAERLLKAVEELIEEDKRTIDLTEGNL